ncbi:unnamed protein product [Cuscuta europaea]|uniref:ATP-dependent DNA helicase n=1 Tax=Cuscuta europaea TaxID=41803 RepID=A0A9P0ZH94_CUSEU|nr:unnamed protein product [Cuscuta europaea]
MPCPDESDMTDFQNKFLVDEMSYDREQQVSLHSSLLEKLTAEQRHTYDHIITVVYSNLGGFFVLYGYGGTGKTFVWNTLSAALRLKGSVVLNVASSRIASLLLPGGKTAHSTFCIPFVTNEESTSNIRQGSLKAKLLLHAKLIIWDEAPMLSRHCFEAVDRTLRDIMRVQCEENSERPFGGKVVVLGGDFCQILPVIRKGTRHDIVSAAVNSSHIWESCVVLRLSTNMRLNVGVTSEDHAATKEFADWTLQLGEGSNESHENGASEVQIPSDLLINGCKNPLHSLVDFTYPELLQNHASPTFYGSYFWHCSCASNGVRAVTF